MDASTLDKVLKVRGVRGAARLDASGAVAESRFEDTGLDDLARRMGALARALSAAGAFGSVSKVVLRSERDDDFSLFLVGDEAVAVSADRLRPASMLGEDVRKALG
jgi:hypothetical protein